MLKTLRKGDVDLVLMAGDYVKQAIESGDPEWRAWYVQAGKEYKKGRRRKDKKK
jgi:hypothetical protein